MNPDPLNQPSSVTGPAREEQSYSLVLFAGLATTGLALLGVYLFNTKTEDFRIMGWYADYVLPVGALIVGLVAASGYGLASWFSGIKITRRLLLLVLLLQLAAYFAAQYIEFTHLKLIHRGGRPVGFLEYYDLVARSFAWRDDKGMPGKPLGLWGYFFRALELAGFALGGLIVPLVLHKTPYCHACQRYMKTQQIGLVPASVSAKKVKKSDVAATSAYQVEQQKAFDGGKRMIESLTQLALDNKPPDFLKTLGEVNASKKQTMKLPGRISLGLVHCRRCYCGSLVAHLVVGHGKRMKRTEFSRSELNTEFVRSVDLDRPTA